MIDIFQKFLWKQHTVENHLKKFQMYFPVPPIPDRPNTFSILRTFHIENSRSNGDCFGNHTVWIQNTHEARVEIYLGMASKEKNKALFDFLLGRKDSIEETLGMQLI